MLSVRSQKALQAIYALEVISLEKADDRAMSLLQQVTGRLITAKLVIQLQARALEFAVFLIDHQVRNALLL
ncbi:hypothetical protein D3C77_375480 [compost metagenome]